MSVEGRRSPSVEATGLAWFKSSYSGANTTECVEAAFVAQAILIRDSKNPDGPYLRVAGQAWTDFLLSPRHIGPA
ncbi:DUF397 domain-containing protein [Streptomyces sp. NPDC046939]|uniref:DUF397 domain-containing protein n=1 Tax=Streptomyces sp. NPDC046939 TaxID=3155376 RepID=UPI0033FCCE6B